MTLNIVQIKLENSFIRNVHPISKTSNIFFQYFYISFFPIYSIEFISFLEKLAHNVLGIRRFCSPNKGLRSKTRAAKMWVELGVGMERSGMT